MNTTKVKNYILRVFDGHRVLRVETRSIRRFYNKIAMIDWSKSKIKVYLKVIYGKFPDHAGKLQTFFNDGTYETKDELLQVLSAFTEKY